MCIVHHYGYSSKNNKAFINVKANRRIYEILMYDIYKNTGMAKENSNGVYNGDISQDLFVKIF